MDKLSHSVRLEKEKCIGCTNCVRHCPTQAIRVRGGKAKIIDSRCIDCGECIKVCPQHAKKSSYDKLSEVFDGRFKYTIALPAPSLFGQFNNLDNPEYVIAGLKKMGFDEVYEVAKAAEIISDYTRRYLEQNSVKRPVISSACPVVVKLIRVRFPDLCENVLPILTPVELAAKMAKAAVVKKTGYAPEEIGCIFISPCPSKRTAAKYPFFTDDSGIDAVVSMSKTYIKLVNYMTREETDDTILDSGIIGISWASSGGEAAALLKESYLAADGIENVIKVLNEIEDEKLGYIDFVELNACTGGCVGGVLTVENPFVAKARIQNLRKYMPVSKNFYNENDIIQNEIAAKIKLEGLPPQIMDINPTVALEKMMQIEEISKSLPGFDCGSCGAPTCHALAEDTVLGYARQTDCVFSDERKTAGLLKESKGDERFVSHVED